MMMIEFGIRFVGKTRQIYNTTRMTALRLQLFYKMWPYS